MGQRQVFLCLQQGHHQWLCQKRDDFVQFFFVGIDTNASEDGFDGSGIWSIVSTELSKKIGSDVTHFKLDEHETNVC